MKALFLAVLEHKVLVHYECNACRLASLLLQRLYFCCRLEAPRYRRVSPANGEPQRLIITKEVGANIHSLLQTNCVWPEAVIALVYESDKLEYYHVNHFFLCRRQQCDLMLWQQCWGTSPSHRSDMTASLSCRRNSTKTSAGQTSCYTLIHLHTWNTFGVLQLSGVTQEVSAGNVDTVACECLGFGCL